MDPPRTCHVYVVRLTFLTYKKPLTSCSFTQVWNFLFPLPPLCLTLDPADRAFYAGFVDGSTVSTVLVFYRDSLPQPSFRQSAQPYSANNDSLQSIKSSAHKLETSLFSSPMHETPGNGFLQIITLLLYTTIAVMYEGNFVVSGNR